MRLANGRYQVRDSFILHQNERRVISIEIRHQSDTKHAKLRRIKDD